MGKKPYIAFYIGDYMKKTRTLTLEEKGAWTEMIWHMHNTGETGLVDGTWQDIALAIGCDVAKAKQLFSKISFKKVCDLMIVTPDENPAHEIIQIRNRRMFKQYLISLKRRQAGSIGAENKYNINLANGEHSSENESEYDNDNEKTLEKRKKLIPPILDEVKLYFHENGYREDIAIRAFNFYNEAKWHDSKGNPVRNWKQKMISVWFKDENKIQDKNTISNPQKVMPFPENPDMRWQEMHTRDSGLVFRAWDYWRSKGWKKMPDGSWEYQSKK